MYRGCMKPPRRLPGDERWRVLAGLPAQAQAGRPAGLWKAQEWRPRWKYAWTYLEELITTSAGITGGAAADD